MKHLDLWRSSDYTSGDLAKCDGCGSAYIDARRSEVCDSDTQPSGLYGTKPIDQDALYGALNLVEPI